MQKLISILSVYNEHPYVFPQTVPPSLPQHMTGSFYSIFTDNYLKDTPHHNPLSGSQIGKPGVILAWEKFNKVDLDKPSFAQKRKWFGGHLFELEIMHLLERLGYSYQWQPNINVFGLIPGHPDFVVDGENGKFLVECKNVGNAKYNEYKKGMSNAQYITQFALYCSHYSCPGMWVIGNADTGELFCLVLPTYQRVLEMYQKYIVDAVNTHSVVTRIESFNECLHHLEMPRPTNRKDGTRGIPPYMYLGKGNLHPVCCLYDYTVDDQGRYTVSGYNYPEEMKHMEPIF